MKVLLVKHFRRQLKKLIKKLPNLKSDFLNFFDGFSLNAATSVGRSVYKVRIASSDLGRGKSAGLRCYIYFYKKEEAIVPLCIYLKSQKVNLTDNELAFYLRLTLQEL